MQKQKFEFLYDSKTGTYIPGHFAHDSLEWALIAHPVEWLQARGEEGPLEVHILDVQVNAPAPFHALDGEVEPGPATEKRSYKGYG